MPVTRSAAARSKVQQSGDPDSSSVNKQDEHEQTSNGAMVNGELPKTVKDPPSDEKHLKTSTALLLLTLIFLTSLIALGAVYLSFPHLDP